MNAPQTASTVYIVDDDEAVRDSLRWLLEANNYRVRAFPSGESFLAEYDEQRPGVLIVDVRMPGMSGLELQEQLIARKSSMPIVFITGHGDVPMAVSTIKKGAIDFLENHSTRLICVKLSEECSNRPMSVCRKLKLRESTKRCLPD